MGISTLRTVFSLAWVGGSAALRLPAARRELPSGVYGTAALMYAVAALVASFVAGRRSRRRRPGWRTSRPTTGRRDTMDGCWLTVGRVHPAADPADARRAGAAPVRRTPSWAAMSRDAGLILGLCAALEIPLMLGFGALSTRMPLRLLLFLGAGLRHRLLRARRRRPRSLWVLVAAQVLNALFIAAVAGLGISYMQDMLPRQPGPRDHPVRQHLPARRDAGRPAARALPALRLPARLLAVHGTVRGRPAAAGRGAAHDRVLQGDGWFCW